MFVTSVKQLKNMNQGTGVPMWETKIKDSTFYYFIL